MKKVIVTFITTLVYLVILDIVMITRDVSLPLVFLFSIATLCCNLPILDILGVRNDKKKIENQVEIISD